MKRVRLSLPLEKDAKTEFSAALDLHDVELSTLRTYTTPMKRVRACTWLLRGIGGIRSMRHHGLRPPPQQLAGRQPMSPPPPNGIGGACVKHCARWTGQLPSPYLQESPSAFRIHEFKPERARAASDEL